MHELLLLSRHPLPASRHAQLLQILAGISSMQPIPILEKHLLFKPNRTPTSADRAAGGGQDIQVQKQLQKEAGGDVFFLRVVGERQEMDGSGDYGIQEKANEARWTIQFRDLPEVVRQRAVMARLMADIPISSGDPVKFMEGMGYSLVTSYYVSGHRFTHNNTSILLSRISVPLRSNEHNETLRIPNDASEGRLLDPSGAYIIQASLRVQDGSKVEIMNRGMSELLSLKETLKGVVDLDVGDRLAMDTRVR